MKKAIIFFLCALLSFGTVSCGNKKPALPELGDGAKNVRIGGFIAPPPENYYGNNETYITEERYREIKNVGFDFVVGHAETGLRNENVFAALDCAKAAGVKYFVNADILSFYNATPERLRDAIGEVIAHEACMGIFVNDEPSAKRFRALGALQSRFEQVTDKIMHVNLLPYVEDANMLGVPTYGEYLDSYCASVDNDFISMDIYPFYEKAEGERMRYSMSQDWLKNLEMIQTRASEHCLEHWQCVQGQKVFGHSKEPDYFDMRMQIYTSMAYGAEVFQYYCYFTPKESVLPCLIDKDGTQTSLYADAKKINDEIHAFGKMFVHFASGWKGVLPVGACEDFDRLSSPLKKTERIESIQASENALIGVFEDEDGRDAFLVTNYTVPGDRLNNEITIKFNRTAEAVCYIGGVRSEKQLEKGELRLTLGPGEGVFVLPI